MDNIILNYYNGTSYTVLNPMINLRKEEYTIYTLQETATQYTGNGYFNTNLVNNGAYDITITFNVNKTNSVSWLLFFLGVTGSHWVNNTNILLQVVNNNGAEKYFIGGYDSDNSFSVFQIDDYVNISENTIRLYQFAQYKISSSGVSIISDNSQQNMINNKDKRYSARLIYEDIAYI